MPKLSKSTFLDRWIDQFSDMNLEEQAFALAQVSAIHRQAQRQKEREVDGLRDAVRTQKVLNAEPDDLPFDDKPVSG